MIYFCADDYGLCEGASLSIQKCIDEGALNRVSVFTNFDRVDLYKIQNNKNLRLALHLNLVEGKCMANADEIPLLADENGNFKHTFVGLLKLSLIHGKEFETQVYKEIKAQVSFWKSILPKGAFFCIDGHQHTHMIPSVFRPLLKVLKDEKIDLKHMRIPAEPILPYIKTPTLYFTYSPENIIKQWLLKFLWLFNKKSAKEYGIKRSYFMGILFSGKMDEKRVSKILPEYIKLANKKGADIELLFHPGYLDGNNPDFKERNIVFEKFYLSEDRKTEFDSVIKYSERR